MNLDRAAATSRSAVLIGVDGGASGFRAYEVVVRATPRGPRLALGTHAFAEQVEPVAGFVPLNVELQREQARTRSFEYTREERVLQGRWIHAASRAIWHVAVECGRDVVKVGVCTPGLKTADQCGIEVSLHGPRMPDFAEALAQSLVLGGLNLCEPVARVFSDGLACAHGEELAESGSFSDVENAYYLGGGSGVAEAYKLAGKITAADELAPGILKAWQMSADDGRSFETHLSASGLNQDFAPLSGTADESAPFPEDAAAAGDRRALDLFQARASTLAQLCSSRLIAVHEQRGLVLERIVIGQRLGQLFLDPRLASCFARPACAALSARLMECAPPAVRAAWTSNAELVPGRLIGSSLRAAAALGALALALESD